MDKEKQRTTPQASMKSKSSLRRTQKKANTCRLDDRQDPTGGDESEYHRGYDRFNHHSKMRRT